MTQGNLLSTRVVPLSPGVVELSVHGEIDIATAPVLHRAILDAIDEHRPTLLRVDVAAVPFMDSTGLGALIAGRNHAHQRGTHLAILRPVDRVRRVLEVTGLHGLLGCDGTPQPPTASPPSGPPGGAEPDTSAVTG